MAKHSKIVYFGETLMDLTGDTVEASKLLKGITAHDKSGEAVVGSCEFDSDTSDDTVVAAEILAGKTAHARGAQVIGTMPNRGAVNETLTTVAGKVAIAQGYHDGSGTVQIDATEQAKLIPANIRQGVEVLGITGTMSGNEGVNAQSKTVTSGNEDQTVMPDSGYTHLSQVVVKKVPYTVSDNAAGGTTVTIG